MFNKTLSALAISLSLNICAADQNITDAFSNKNLLSDSAELFTGDYRNLVLCEETSHQANQERYKEIIEIVLKKDPIFHGNIDLLREIRDIVLKSNESVFQEFTLICNRFMNSSEHMNTESIADAILEHNNFILSTSFGLIAHELQLEGRLDEIREIVLFYAEEGVPNAKIMLAGFFIEDGDYEEALSLAVDVASEGLAIAHLTIGSIFYDAGEIEKAYAWTNLGLKGVVRTHSELITRRDEMKAAMSDEQLIKAKLLEESIEAHYPVKPIDIESNL
ncbi:exported hypothetical protein [Vibrio chagasii]|nr:exported hypothetical protein [Vibrio chagasii]